MQIFRNSKHPVLHYYESIIPIGNLINSKYHSSYNDKIIKDIFLNKEGLYFNGSLRYNFSFTFFQICLGLYK